MPLDAEGSSIVLPLVYDCTNNVTQLAERRDATSGAIGPSSGSPLAQTVSLMLKRFTDYGHSLGLQPGDCSIFPAIRDVLINLTLPNEPQVMNTAMQQQPPNMGQVNVPMGLGSGPGPVGMGNMGSGTPVNPLQMQGGPMAMGVGLQQQAQPQTQVSMPIQSPYNQGMNAMNANPMAAMNINNLNPNMNNMPTMGQAGPGMMQ